MFRHSRRVFLKRFSLLPAGLAAGIGAGCEGKRVQPRGLGWFGGWPKPYRVRFGLISDVHQDVMPDGVQRIRAFVEAMKEAKADFIVQLGDFCQPKPANQPFLDAWNAFPGPRYHVLGNHDMDGGFKVSQTVAWYGMTAPYYSFELGAFRFLVLNGNEAGGATRGYARYVGSEQMAWLERELVRDCRPALLFIHQPPDHPDGLVNGERVRRRLWDIQAGPRPIHPVTDKTAPYRISAVFCGHLHQDYDQLVQSVRYVQINSASYAWLGDKYARETYPPDVHKAYRHLRCVAAYREPVWALVTADLTRDELIVEGRRSEWVGPDPWQRGVDEKDYPRDRVRPEVSGRKFSFI